MRLIDADVLEPHEQLEPMGNGNYEYVEVVYKDDIDDVPTIDAVEVVRCRECKYGEERIEDYRCWMLDEDWDIRFSPMHFCSYGQRREE